MGMGFILPFALTFVAIPLESFIHSSRTVLGILAAAVLRILSVTLRILGNIVRYAGTALTHLYDLIIFAPLWLESVFGRAKNSTAATRESVQAVKPNPAASVRQEDDFDAAIASKSVGAGS
jgi:hypothetical protein